MERVQDRQATKENGDRTMNWQLLKNVNPPVEKLLLFYYPDQTIRFALRSKDGKVFYIGDSFIEGAIEPPYDRLSDEELKRNQGYGIYWSLFVKP